MKRSFPYLLLLFLALSLAACQAAIPPFGQDSAENSRPVFFATPVVDLPPTPSANEVENAPEPGVTPASPAGELYITLYDFSTNTLSLVRTPGDCLVNETSCPETETVEGFPNFNESIRPLVWSPDGRMAALALNETLYVYQPDKEAWTLAAEMMLTDQPEWSPDSSWLAFAAQNGTQKDIFMVRPDGSDLSNLTRGSLGGTEYQLAGVSWTGTNSLSFWHFAQQQRKELLSLRLDTGEMSPLLTMSELTKDVLVYSPDRQQVAMESLENGITHLIRVQADGTSASTLGSFGQSSIWPLVWSPDGRWLAFSNYGAPGMEQAAWVYVVPADGSTAAVQVLEGQNVGALVWGPDSRHLVVQAEQAGASHLFLVDALDLSVSSLTFANVAPTIQMQGVSWRFLP